MPSSQTPNYQLNQWERSDKVQMEDFNADNAKIDAGLKAEANARAAGDAALSARIPEIVTGSYTGNGAAERFLPLPFTPKAVYLCADYGATQTTGIDRIFYMGGLMVQGGPLVISELIYGQIVTGGIQLFYKEANTRVLASNRKNTDYHYIALSW